MPKVAKLRSRIKIRNAAEIAAGECSRIHSAVHQKAAEGSSMQQTQLKCNRAQQNASERSAELSRAQQNAAECSRMQQNAAEPSDRSIFCRSILRAPATGIRSFSLERELAVKFRLLYSLTTRPASPFITPEPMKGSEVSMPDFLPDFLSGKIKKIRNACLVICR
jgi:hypothetical protein